MKPLEALRALGPGIEPPVQARERVYSALLASLSVAGGSAASGAAAATKGPASLPPVPTPLLAGVASSKLLSVAAVIWLLGGATGAALYGALRPPSERVVYVD